MAKRLDKNLPRKKQPCLTPQYQEKMDEDQHNPLEEQLKGIRQLQSVLRTPSEHKEQQVLEILKANPTLMRTYLQHRQQSCPGPKQLQQRRTNSFIASSQQPPTQQLSLEEQHGAFAQLTTALLTPGPEQQARIFTILLENPPILEAYLKRRQGMAGTSDVNSSQSGQINGDIEGVSAVNQTSHRWDQILAALDTMNFDI